MIIDEFYLEDLAEQVMERIGNIGSELDREHYLRYLKIVLASVTNEIEIQESFD